MHKVLQYREEGTEHILSHLGADDIEASNVGENLHGKVAVGHSTINLEVLQVSSRIELHAFDNSASLESVSF